MKQFLIQFAQRPWSREEKLLTVLSATLLGLVLGLFFSPCQKGINFMSKNGCNNTNTVNPKEKLNKNDVL